VALRQGMLATLMMLAVLQDSEHLSVSFAMLFSARSSTLSR